MVRLAGNTRSGSPAASAADHLRECAAAGTVPLGLERLHATMNSAERSDVHGTGDSGGRGAGISGDGPDVPGTPAAKRSAPTSAAERLEDALARHPCVVLRADDATTVADGLAGLLTTGATVLVAGEDATALTELRDALPRPLRALCLYQPLPMADDERRELRMLLLTGAEARRARSRQWLPSPELVPSQARLAELGVAPPAYDPSGGGVELIPYLLDRLPREKAARLVSSASTCRDALRALVGKGGTSWSWPLLERLAFGADHVAFDALMATSAAVVSAAGSLNGPAYRMVIVGPPPPDATERLAAHIEHLESGGSTRRYFASERQRSVTSLLRQLGMEPTAVGDVGALREALTALQLTRAMRHIALLCVELGVPEPTSTPAGVRRRHDELRRLADAVDAVGTLRREVLFIHPTSPVAVPDLAAAEAVASAVVAASTALPRAREELTHVAERLHGPPGCEPAPEALEVAAALRAADLPRYREAVHRLDAAHREYAEQVRVAELLGRVRAVAPELAAAWASGARDHGTARFLTPADLLVDLSADEPADVLVLLEAHRMGPENLLAAAAATRLVAVCPAGAGDTPPDSAAGALLDAGAAQVRTGTTEEAPTAPDGITQAGITTLVPQQRTAPPRNVAPRNVAPLQRDAPPPPGNATPPHRNATPQRRGATPAQRGATPAQRGAAPAQRDAPPKGPTSRGSTPSARASA